MYVTKGHKIVTLENDFFVQKMTSRLARTLKIGRGKVFAQGILKLHLKPLKINCF